MTTVPEATGSIYGLFCTCHPEAGVRYVGQTSRRLEDRLYDHTYAAPSGRTRLYRWMRKHGVENVRQRLLEACPISALDQRERAWIESLDTHRNGLNVTMGGKWNDEGVQRGSANLRARLTEEQVIEICDLLNEGLGQAQIAQRYHVSRSCIAGISRGGNWAHITAGRLLPGLATLPRTGVTRKGEECGNSSLKAQEVLAIREAYEPLEGVTTYTLAQRYGVSPITIQAVVRGDTWRHILPDDYAPAPKNEKPRSVIDEAAVRDIKERLRGGRHGIGSQLAREYGVSPMAISDIKRGKTWADV